MSCKRPCTLLACRANAESLTRCQGAGDPDCWGESHGETVRSAGSFSASPSANPAGRRKRSWSCGCEPPVALFCRSDDSGHPGHPSATVATGGVAAGGSAASGGPAPRAPPPAAINPHGPGDGPVLEHPLQGPGLPEDRHRRDRPLPTPPRPRARRTSSPAAAPWGSPPTPSRSCWSRARSPAT